MSHAALYQPAEKISMSLTGHSSDISSRLFHGETRQFLSRCRPKAVVTDRARHYRSQHTPDVRAYAETYQLSRCISISSPRAHEQLQGRVTCIRSFYTTLAAVALELCSLNFIQRPLGRAQSEGNQTSSMTNTLSISNCPLASLSSKHSARTVCGSVS